jgi:acetoacetate decarboxylase
MHEVAGGGVPAPWTLRGEAHVLLLNQPRQGRGVLAPGVTLRRGGLGVLALARYAESNVGAYDELLWLVPWGLQVDGRRLHHVPRIYVSTEASRSNGRSNWGIPKELAVFDVQRLSPNAQLFHVTAAAGVVARFVVESGRRAVGVGSGLLPAGVRRLGQVDEGRLFELAPSVRAHASTARFADLYADPQLLSDVRGARWQRAFSLRNVELLFPVPRVRSLA